MGASNVKAVYARWGGLDHLPFRALTYMAVVSHDGMAPRYWAGREALALAVGRPVPDAVRADTAVAAVRRAAFKAVDRIVDALTAAGAIVQTGTAHPGRNAEYTLNLTGQAALFDGQVLADPVDLVGRCGVEKRPGDYCLAWPKKGTSRCIAHQEWTPVSGPNAPRSVDLMHPGEWTNAPRSMDIMHPAHRGPEEEQEQQEQVRTTGQDESLDLDTDLPVVRARPRCQHGFVIAHRPNGQPTCVLCRRETPCPADHDPATPTDAPHPTADPTDASAEANDSPDPTPNHDWPTPASTTTAGHSQPPADPQSPPAPSLPARAATHPSPSKTLTPAAGKPPLGRPVCRDCATVTGTHEQLQTAPALCPKCASRPNPRPADAVWIATERRDITAHRWLGNSNHCGRPGHTGHVITADQATKRHAASWCRRCWPNPQEKAA